jgi:hypothetical protein
MGSTSRGDRSDRFIREFNADFNRRFGFGVGARLVVIGEGLAFDDRDEVVRYEVVARPEGTEEEIRFMLAPVFYDPEEPEDDQIEEVAETLEAEPDTVRRRFEDAGLAGRRS